MSHFAVLVPAGDESELYERLIPYYEYGASTERDDDLRKRGLLEFVSVEEEYRQEYENGGVEMVRMPDGRLLYQRDNEFRRMPDGRLLYRRDNEFRRMPDGRLLYRRDNEFRVPGTFGSDSGTHKVPEDSQIVHVLHRDRYESFEQFVNDWAGYEFFDEKHGTYGYYRNSNSKWDWYTIGGRASGILSGGIDEYNPEDDPRNWKVCDLCRGTGKRRDVVNMLFGGTPPPFACGGVHPLTGETQEAWDTSRIEKYLRETGCNGCEGKGVRLKYPSEWIVYDGDSPLAGEVDWPALRAKKLKKALELWNQYKKDYGFWYTSFYRWIGLSYHLAWPVVCKMKWWFIRDGFWKLSRWLLKKLTKQKETPDWKYGIRVGQSRKQFIARESGAVTYAFVDLDGNWNQQGEMGWWGMDDESKGTPNYDGMFWDFVQNLPPEQRIYVVDCHI